MQLFLLFNLTLGHITLSMGKMNGLTRQEESLVHSKLFSESDVAEVFLAFAYGGDIATLSEDLHDELLCGVLRQTADKHRLTPWRAISRGWRGKVCSKVAQQRRENTVMHQLTIARLNINTGLEKKCLNDETMRTCIYVISSNTAEIQTTQEMIQLSQNTETLLV